MAIGPCLVMPLACIFDALEIYCCGDACRGGIQSGDQRALLHAGTCLSFHALPGLTSPALKFCTKDSLLSPTAFNFLTRVMTSMPAIMLKRRLAPQAHRILEVVAGFCLLWFPGADGQSVSRQQGGL